jgi:hypothetical protein
MFSRKARRAPGAGPPLPFADSSPLASRAFWTPIILVLSAVGVLWLSRGVRLPP